MPLGNPIYGTGDEVSFPVQLQEDADPVILTGTIRIVDAYGVFEDNTRCYYDIYVEDAFDGEPCLFKHIAEEAVDSL